MDKAKFSFIMNAMRRASYKWYGRYNAEKRTHIGRNQYLCEKCGGTFKKKETQMDHIDPVVPLEGSEDLNVLLDRLLAVEEGWQRLCKPCHQDKTNIENEQRRALKGEPLIEETPKTKKQAKKK